MSSGKLQSFCLGLNVLRLLYMTYRSAEVSWGALDYISFMKDTFPLHSSKYYFARGRYLHIFVKHFNILFNALSRLYISYTS